MLQSNFTIQRTLKLKIKRQTWKTKYDELIDIICVSEQNFVIFSKENDAGELMQFCPSSTSDDKRMMKIHLSKIDFSIFCSSAVLSENAFRIAFFGKHSRWFNMKSIKFLWFCFQVIKRGISEVHEINSIGALQKYFIRIHFIEFYVWSDMSQRNLFEIWCVHLY